MHDKSSRDDNQVVDMFCFQYQHSTCRLNFFVSEVLATPKSLSKSKSKSKFIFTAQTGYTIQCRLLIL